MEGVRFWCSCSVIWLLLHCRWAVSRLECYIGTEQQMAFGGLPCNSRVDKEDGFLLKLSKPSGHYMYRQFNIQQFHVLLTHCIYVFCVDLRTNSHYFPIQH